MRMNACSRSIVGPSAVHGRRADLARRSPPRIARAESSPTPGRSFLRAACSRIWVRRSGVRASGGASSSFSKGEHPLKRGLRRTWTSSYGNDPGPQSSDPASRRPHGAPTSHHSRANTHLRHGPGSLLAGGIGAPAILEPRPGSDPVVSSRNSVPPVASTGDPRVLCWTGCPLLRQRRRR